MVTVQADRPKVIKSGFTKDLRTIWFQFDQNVEGVDSCTDIFTSITLTQIGYGIIFVLIKIGIIDRLTIILYIGSFFLYIDAVCWFSTDHLTVLVGNVKTIKDNKFTIQFSSNSNIRTYRSWTKLSSSMLNKEIIVPIIPSEVIIKLVYFIQNQIVNAFHVMY